MKRYLQILSMLVLSAALMASCGGDGGETETAAPERLISVKAEVVKLTDDEVIRSFTGSLEGEKQAVMYAKIAEAVEKVNVREGELVKADAVLLSLDKDGPSSNFLQSKSLFLNAEKNYKKMDYLYKEGAVSESQFDAAKTDYEVARASFEAASQLVEIKSPIGGMVTALDVSEGDFVQVGRKLATVATTSKLRVKFGVNPSDIGSFSKGAEVVISADAVQGAVKGEVVAVATSADPVTRAFEVEALVDNSDGHYKPGMFVRISIVLEKLENVITVPRKAIVTLDNQQAVFVVSNGLAEKRPVVLGPEIDGHAVITSGINAGDTVVTVGQDYIDDGFSVKIASLNEGK